MNNKITIRKNVKIINDEYVVKAKKESLASLYDYLTSRSFSYFPKIIKEDKNKYYYEYISDMIEPPEQKINDLIILLSLLHNKTSFYKEVDLDYYKTIYETVNDEIAKRYNYYNELMDNIDNEVFMSPANYLIARNITLLYRSLNYAKENIDTWYKLIADKRKVRLATIHNNLSLDHYLKNDKPYLISWDKAKVDMPIYDLVKLYQTHYLDFEFDNLINLYLTKFPLSKEELSLFLTLISIPDQIIKAKTEYETVKNVRRLLDYVYKTNDLREKYRIKQEANKTNEFQKKN